MVSNIVYVGLFIYKVCMALCTAGQLPRRQTHGGSVAPPALSGISRPPCRPQTRDTPSAAGSSDSTEPPG